MKTEKIAYSEGDAQLEGHLAYSDDSAGPRPLVLVAHAWAGQSDTERGKAEALAELGYVGFATDVYGKGVLG
ncbi:MAG: dienelactone hydrolase family protein, partial [Myxococcota bacterium]